MSVFHSESAFYCSKLDKAEPFVQMPRMDVCRHDRVELQNSKTCNSGPGRKIIFCVKDWKSGGAVAERSGAMQAEAGTLESLTATCCRHALVLP